MKNHKVQWSGKSETFVNPEQIEMEQRLASMKAMYELDPDNEQLLNQIADLTMAYIERFQRIDEAVPFLKGYKPGVYIINGKRVLVQAHEHDAGKLPTQAS